MKTSRANPKPVAFFLLTAIFSIGAGVESVITIFLISIFSVVSRISKVGFFWTPQFRIWGSCLTINAANVDHTTKISCAICVKWNLSNYNLLLEIKDMDFV